MPIQLIFSILGILYVIAVVQALLMAAFFVFQKKGIASSRAILALLMLVFAIFLTGTFLLLFFSRWQYIYYAHLVNLIIFLAPPLLYFYFLSLIDQSFRFGRQLLVHALPFAAILLIMLYVVTFRVDKYFVFRPFGIVLIGALFAQNIYYLRKIYVEKKGAFTNGLSSKAKWFGYLFGAIFFIFLFKLLIFVVWNVLDYVDICIFFTGMFFILSFILINLLVLYSLLNPDQLVNYFKYQSMPAGNLKPGYYDELLQLLEQKKLYLDPLLTLDRLARHLNITGKQLSAVINEYSGNNFNDFINKYRIGEAQQRIQNNKDQANILSIAYDVGFNSKSTFNTAFKKFADCTPSAYRKKTLR